MSLATTFHVAREDASRCLTQAICVRPRMALSGPDAVSRFAEFAVR